MAIIELKYPNMANFSTVTRIVLAQYGQTQHTTTTCGKTKDGINHQYAGQLAWCVLGEIIERKPEIVAIIDDCTF